MRNVGIVCGPRTTEDTFLLSGISSYKQIDCEEIDYLILLDSSRDIASKRKTIS